MINDLSCARTSHRAKKAIKIMILGGQNQTFRNLTFFKTPDAALRYVYCSSFHLSSLLHLVLSILFPFSSGFVRLLSVILLLSSIFPALSGFFSVFVGCCRLLSVISCLLPSLSGLCPVYFRSFRFFQLFSAFIRHLSVT